MKPETRCFCWLHAAAVVLLVAAASDSPGQFSTVINVPPDAAPASIGSDTQLNVSDGGVIPSTHSDPFQAGLSVDTSSNIELNIAGGSVGDGFTANAGATVNLSGGQVGEDFTLRGGAVLNMSGGQVGAFAAVVGRSRANVSGGIFGFLQLQDGASAEFSGGSFNEQVMVVDSSLSVIGSADLSNVSLLENATLFVEGGGVGFVSTDLFSDVELNGGSLGGADVLLGSLLMSGGEFTGQLSLGSSEAVITGGTFGAVVSISADSVLEFVGSAFQLDGSPIPGLTEPGQGVVVSSRDDALLTGQLADGSLFDLVLTEGVFATPGQDRFSPGSTLRLTLVPEPAGLACVLFALAAAHCGGARSEMRRRSRLECPPR